MKLFFHLLLINCLTDIDLFDELRIQNFSLPLKPPQFLFEHVEDSTLQANISLYKKGVLRLATNNEMLLYRFNIVLTNFLVLIGSNLDLTMRNSQSFHFTFTVRLLFDLTNHGLPCDMFHMMNYAKLLLCIHTS